MAPRPEICVGAIIVDASDRVLLIERGRGAAVGLWSVPGGRVEPGESLEQAVVREVAEETGLTVRCGRFVGWVERIGDDHHFVIMDFLAEVVGEQDAPVAGDDAADVAWIPLDRLGEHRLVDGLLDFFLDHDLV
ncbi:MAG: NUDIX domain-containing protein [Actinomycetota bacterium]